MVFWKKWLLKWKKTQNEEPSDPEEQAENVVLHRDDVDLHDRSQRKRYVKSCLEQMRDCEEEIRALTREYSRVTSHLTDMEEIEALPDPERETVRAAAEKIYVYEQQQSEYLERKRMMRHAYQYRRHELERTAVNMRGMMIICSFAFVTCMILLLLLRVLLEMDVQIGCLLAVAATVIAVFFIYLKYTESVKELHRVEKTVNRLILLQNRVKTQALLAHGEMVEIRHGLIVRRQKLRKQMEYNENLAESAKAEIKSLAEEFPIYRDEIFAMVEQYEKNGNG